MISAWFDRLYAFVGNHRNALLFIIVLLLVISSLRMVTIPFTNDITSMLPDNPVVRRQLDFLSSNDMAGTVALSVSLKNRTTETTLKTAGGTLLTRSAELGTALTALPQVSNIVTGIEDLDIKKARNQLISALPQLLSKAQYALSASENSPEWIEKRLRQLYIMLTTPGSGFLQSTMRTDPLGWSDPIMEAVNRMAGTMGYRVKLNQGRFVDATGKAALMVMQTSVSVTDGKSGRKLLDAIDSAAQSFPDLQMIVVCGHQHTVSNETVIKEDVRMALTLVTVAFGILMFWVFRSADAVLIFMAPFGAIVVSIALASLLYKELSLFMMGFAAVIAGISVDYGIHAYTAFQSGGYDKFKETARLIVIAALTTGGVFLSFYGSSVKGYHELAAFSILSILICVLIYLFVVPRFWRMQKDDPLGPKAPQAFHESKPSHRFKPLKTHKRLRPPFLVNPAHEFKENREFFFDVSCLKTATAATSNPMVGRLIIGVWLLIIFFSSLSISTLSFSTDITSFDGTDTEILLAEKRFNEIWQGGKQPGIVVVETGIGADGKEWSQEGWHRYDRLSRKISAKEKSFISLAQVWPSVERRQDNVLNFKAYWTEARRNEIEKRVALASEKYGFSKRAFQPFFDLLTQARSDSFETGQMPDLFLSFKERFISSKEDGVELLGYFDDTPSAFSKIHSLVEKYPGAYVVSRKALSDTISKQVFSDMTRVSLFSGGWVVLLAALFLRRIRHTVLALVPVVTSVLVVFAVLSLLQIQANVVVLITLIVILGLSIDYGVFLSSFQPGEARGPAIKAVTFSMVTTVAGTIGLLLASHPVMFMVGVTMISGVITAYLTALFVIPALERTLRFG